MDRIARRARSLAMWIAVLAWMAEITAVCLGLMKVAVVANGAGVVTTAGAYSRAAEERKMLARALGRKVSQPEPETPALPALHRVR